MAELKLETQHQDFGRVRLPRSLGVGKAKAQRPIQNSFAGLIHVSLHPWSSRLLFYLFHHLQAVRAVLTSANPVAVNGTKQSCGSSWEVG